MRCLKGKLNFPTMLIFINVAVFGMKRINANAQEHKVVQGIMDVHSNVSDGFYAQKKLAELAQEKGLSVLMFGDSALRKWEYGLWPLRNIIKKTYQENSVLRLGAKRYFDRFIALKKEFPDLVLIPGLEVSPYFYWEGAPFSKNFALIDYYKQFLVTGLSPQDYQNLPIVGNRRFFYLSKNGVLGYWPILLIILGLRLLRKKFLRIAFILTGVIFLLNNLPFPTSRFNVYQGNLGVKPYQDLIDYVNQRGGLVFWAHPEIFSQKVYFGIEFYTAAHPEDLILTHDYTGFGVSLYDKLQITQPGNIWDKILLEYIEDKRKNPVWIIATAHYAGPQGGIDYAQTLFFVKEQREEDILGALREGKMYVRFNLGKEPVVLSEFRVKNAGSGRFEIIIKGNQSPAVEPVKIELIRNGKVFKSFAQTSSDWTITVEDNLSPNERRAYYRLRISNDASLILSNPVFVDSDKENL